MGIHGQELPLYMKSEDSKRWWKYFPRGEPKIDSLLRLKQEHKYWAVNDEMLLNDVCDKAGPEDPFKMGRIKMPGEKPIAEKVTKVKHFDDSQLLNVIAPEKNRKM